MESVIVLKHIRVEAANAITGLTYGFPAISNFLGFTHALSRKVKEKLSESMPSHFSGCAVVCHEHHVQEYDLGGFGGRTFSLSRNPLNKKGETAAFNEEGKVNLDVSIVIASDLTMDDIDLGTNDINLDKQAFEKLIYEQAVRLRVAGGLITDIGKVTFLELPENSDDRRKTERKLAISLLPGFVMVDRNDVLQKHYLDVKAENPAATLVDAWIDFSELRYTAREVTKENSDDVTIEWERKDRPASGWLVPISVGYTAISPLIESGSVAKTRDPNTPFRFVECVYSIGEWFGVHRVKDFSTVMWQYSHEQDNYICKSNYKTSIN